MPDFTYQALGPLTPGTERAYLGLQIDEFGRAEPVVLVWLPEYAVKDADLRLRVIRENERASVLEHPNIVKVHGLETVSGRTARVVEFSDGEPLRKVLLAFGGKLPPEFATRVVVDACLGVHFAHEAGNEDGTPMLHGDIRPETVMVGFTGVSKVSGYGALVLAPKEYEGQRRLHVAPEQVLGGREAMNRQTDVYLLGLLLHECLTGKVPFADAPDFEHAVLSDPLHFLSPAEVPPELASIIDRALSKKAAQRFETPQALRQALEQDWPVATHEQFAAAVTEKIPQNDELRLARKREIDAGIAALARQQWKTRIPTGATPAKGVNIAAPQPPPPPPPKPAPVVAAPPPKPKPQPKPAPRSYDDEVSQVSQVSMVGRRPANYTMPLAIGGLVLLAGILIYVITRSAPEKVPARDLLAMEAKDAGTMTATQPVVDAGAPLIDAGLPVETPVVDAGAPQQVVEKPSEPAGLDIEVTPELTIEVDGKVAGTGSVVMNTAPGKHVIRFVDKDGMSSSRTVWVGKEGRVKVRANVGRAYVTIEAPEGALVTIDTRAVGYAPIRGQVPVLEGAHTITVNIGKSKWQESFSLREGQKIHFNVGREHQ